MSQDSREEPPELIPNDGNALTDSEEDLSDDDNPVIGGLSDREVEELINSGDEWALRVHYRWLLLLAGELNIEFDDVTNDELDFLTEEQAHGQPEGPVTPNNFHLFPGRDVDQQMIDSGVECVICLSLPELGKRVTVLPCEHLFHYICIQQWLTRSTTCPLCRQNAVPLEQRDATENNEPGHSGGQRPERHVHWAI
ncbi:hypothetical protein N7486_006129 [Penicillium sp. IBT 16267x]|nr:hypothetical protein N7486_006129 [Penicillium sp. IBT 16267x]